MACSTSRCGRICAKEWSAVTHPTNLGPLHFSSSMMEFTRPLAICWHDLMSVGEISFLPFVSSFLLSFGSKTWKISKKTHEKRVNANQIDFFTVFSSPWKPFSCDESSTSMICSHFRRIASCNERIMNSSTPKASRGQLTLSLSLQGVNHIVMKTSMTSFWMFSSSLTRRSILMQISGILW